MDTAPRFLDVITDIETRQDEVLRQLEELEARTSRAVADFLAASETFTARTVPSQDAAPNASQQTSASRTAA